MVSAYKWAAIAAVVLAIFGLCVWLSDALLPWDIATRIGVGAAAGGVIGAVATAWASAASGETAQLSRHSHAVVNILALKTTPNALSPGQTLELDFQIQLFATETLPVMLGASLVGKGDSEYFDGAGDRFVSLSPGTVDYRRQLRVPHDTPPGTYRLIGAVWYPQRDGRQIARSDQGRIVQITK